MHFCLPRCTCNAGILEYADKDFSDFLFQDIHHIFAVQLRMARQEFVYPVGMFLQLCDSADIFSLYEAFGKLFQLIF